jgi:leucyl-tRNA synthetase
VEHAILHLMYARFFTKVLADEGLVGVQEPFMRLFTQGMITKDGFKMSKSKGNVVPVDDMVKDYGADTGRLFILFIGPPDEDAEWNDRGVEGMQRFLNRIWRLFEGDVSVGAPGQPRDIGDYSPSDRDLLRKVHLTIRKVTEDIERFHFNTAVSAVMELANAMQAYKEAHGPSTAAFTEAATSLLLLMAPMTPHIAAELWERSGGTGYINTQPWPAFMPELAATDVVTVAIQVNGKVRDRIDLPTESGEDEAIAAALASPRVQTIVSGKTLKSARYVPGRLVSIVI